MLSNITIGQYFPGESPVHRLDARTKLVLTVLYVVLLFMADNLAAMAVCAVLLVVAYPLSRIPPGLILRSIKPILPIILMTTVLNMFFVDGDIVWEYGVLRVTEQGLWMALLMTVRIVCLIAGTSLLTYTTSPITLTDGIERLFSPLKKIKAPVHEIAMMMTIALRFIPTLIEETNKIMSAQKARGADLESGGLMQRIRALVPILIPLFVSAFSRAIDLALAMECRCYHGGEGRTRMHVPKLRPADFFAAFVLTLLGCAVVFANRYPNLIVK